MARVLALVPDLMFGSRVQGSLFAAGHEVELIPSESRLRERLGEAGGEGVDVLVVDLTDHALDGAGIVSSLREDGGLGGAATLGFYSHVEVRAREHAVDAGLDLVVPRSRMAREAPELVGKLLER